MSGGFNGSVDGSVNGSLHGVANTNGSSSSGSVSSASLGSSGSGVKKTRNRIPTSCENCRRRKLKCDRRRPCGNCVRSHNESLCKYAAPPTEISPKAKLVNEIFQLKMRIKKLEKILELNNIDPTEYSNISLVLGSDKGSSGLSSPDSLDDPIVSLTDKFDQMVIKGNRLLHSGTTTYMAFITADKRLSRLYEKFFYRHQTTYHDYEKAMHTKASDFPGQCIDSTLTLLTESAYNDMNVCKMEHMTMPGSEKTFEEKSPASNPTQETLRILGRINRKIPPLFALNALVDNFFNRVYGMIPFVDETTFRKELSYTLVETTNGGCRLAITHVQNASIVSLLLIILRFSYLAVNVRDLTENPRLIDSPDLVALIKQNIEIDPSFIGLAKDLLMSMPQQDSVFKKVTLRNIQVLLLLRLYQSYSPELNEENQENAINLAMIIEMVRVYGVNRDPSHFPNVMKNERFNNISRRMFYELFYLDALNSYDYGCPLMIHDDEFDVELPRLNEQDNRIIRNFKKGASVEVTPSKIKEVFIEKSINDATSLRFEATKLLRDGVRTFQKVNEGSKRSSLDSAVRNIETFLSDRLPSITSMVRNSEIEDGSAGIDALFQIFKIPMFRIFELRMSLLSVVNTFYYLLYLNEDEGMTAVKMDCAVKATETSLVLFKNAVDYLEYFTESETLSGDTKTHTNYRKFSQKLEPFLLTRSLSFFQRSMLWLCSVFLGCIEGRGLQFRDLLSRFRSSTDTLMTLDWFNLDLAHGTSEQYLFLLFHYIKHFYFLCFSLRDQFFACWRNSMGVKLFINCLKDTDESMFKRFIDPNLVFSQAGAGMRMGMVHMDQVAVEPSPIPTPPGTSLEDLVNSDLNDFLEFDGRQNVDDILSGNLEEAIDSILEEDGKYTQAVNNFGLFTSGLAEQDVLFGNTANVPARGDEIKSSLSSSKSPFDVDHFGSVSTGGTYMEDSPLIKEKQVNLNDLLKRLQQEPGFEV
ncbi:DEKNAAC105274 [Brettanomyces naardenensis]|uniref:DEKNAAC105274 n=1 Tax=Brettanomyces naardenensis TaxID=13370 RepID=A0A448YST0_BRENA|nr:DEKNAAC105274 [Brettanomyces naardenensis]